MLAVHGIRGTIETGAIVEDNQQFQLFVRRPIRSAGTSAGKRHFSLAYRSASSSFESAARLRYVAGR
jgi:hypothetical protein